MQILDTGKCDINLQSRRGFTPLMVAAWKGELDCCEKIINLGAKLYVKDTGGRNAWGVAHDWHHEEILELLKRNDFHYHEGDTLAFPPAPKWRPEHRDKNL